MKTVDETEMENKLIRAKVFKVYKTNMTDKNDADTGTDKSMTSNTASKSIIAKTPLLLSPDFW